MIPLENVLNKSLQDVLKISWSVLKTLQNFWQISSTCLEDAFPWCLEDVLKTSWRCINKTSWRIMTKTNKMVLTRPSSEDVWLKRIYSSCSLRRLLKRKTKDVLKTSWGRLYQDKCLQGWRGNWQTKLLIMRQKLKHTNLHQKCNLSKRAIKVEKMFNSCFYVLDKNQWLCQR